jgi:hypothetical protein
MTVLNVGMRLREERYGFLKKDGLSGTKMTLPEER